MLEWLFGKPAGGAGDGGVPTPAPAAPAPATAASSAAALASGVEDGPLNLTTSAQFNPDILERIAKAAKELSETPNAKDVLELVRMQEASWQEKFAAAKAEAVLKTKEQEAANLQRAHEERRRTLEEEARLKAAQAEYADKLDRERAQYERQQQQAQFERQLQTQEASLQRQEQEKRRSMEYQERLRQETEMARTKLQMEMQQVQERENKDIRMEQLLAQAKEHRQTVLEGIKVAATAVGDGINDFVSDPKQVGAAIGVVTGLALGVYFAKSGTTVAQQYLTNRLSQPPLIRDTSRRSALLHPVKTLKSIATKSTGDVLEGVVLKPSMQKHLQSITIATAHTRRHKANYRHLMLHGPPGTGKTMFARRLAQQSGLDYAILAGGDVGPLGKSAVTELHRVFDWSEASNKGVLLFVDEADSFLRKRGAHGTEMSEDHRNALSTFLYRTGTPTNKFMLVFATNQPEAFDRAITDRVDEVVEFELPGKDEREQLLAQYFDEYVVRGGGSSAKPIRIDESINTSSWSKLAKELEGFSGRSIAKLCGGWQASAYASVDNVLTKDMLEDVVKRHLQQHDRKEKWESTSA
eukprot:m.29715 g.29715  ORF g.29715 m.29715 type:complete len:582 (+) comp9244_c0_seq1:37-1782(+)